MGMPSIKKFLDPMFIPVSFRFDEPSDEVEQMKGALYRGLSVLLTQTQISNGSGGFDTEVFVHLVALDGKAYREAMREELGAFAGETVGERVMGLGTKCSAAERIMETLASGGDAYLIPDDGPKDGVFGLYTLCYPPA